MNKKLTKKQFLKLHNNTIQQTLKYSDNLILEGVQCVTWKLTNHCTVSFKIGKMAFKKLKEEQSRVSKVKIRGKIKRK